ncbi:MAG: hypothetical protein AAFZ01_13775, partial [Pseudomonadota bacterium]
MAFGSRRVRNHDLTEETARSAMSGSAGVATALLSAFALIFSGLSLYETVLKRATLRIFVPPVVHYGRGPGGDRELFAVPVTIANHGARDAAITGITMQVRALDESGAPKPGESAKLFFAAWFIDAAFFARSKGYNRATKAFERNPRPKRPFAPIAVAGRSAYTGTILFNVVGNTFPVAVSEAGTYELTLRLATDLDESAGVTDRFL